MSREVIIEERRYDKAGQEHTPPANVSTRGEPFDTTSLDGLDALEEVVPVPPSSLAASALAGSFGSSYGDDEATSDNPYAWAQRLRDIPDKVMSQKPAQSQMLLQGNAEQHRLPDNSLFLLHVLSKSCMLCQPPRSHALYIHIHAKSAGDEVMHKDRIQRAPDDCAGRPTRAGADGLHLW